MRMFGINMGGGEIFRRENEDPGLELSSMEGLPPLMDESAVESFGSRMVAANEHPGDPSPIEVNSNRDVGVRQNSKDYRAQIMAQQNAKRAARDPAFQSGSHADIKAAQQQRIDDSVLSTAIARSGTSADHARYVEENMPGPTAEDMPSIRRDEGELMSTPEAVMGPQVPEADERADYSGSRKGLDFGDFWGPNSRLRRMRDDREAAKTSLPVTEDEAQQASNTMTTFEGKRPWEEGGSPEEYHSEGQRTGAQIDQIQKWLGGHGGFNFENRSQIKQLQTKLADLGLYKGDIDGKFGAQSLKSLRAFQAGRGDTTEEYDSRMSQYI